MKFSSAHFPNLKRNLSQYKHILKGRQKMKFLKIKEVMEKTGCGKTKIYAMIKRDEFPHQYKIGSASRWRLDEVEEWIKTRPVSWQKIKSGYEIGYDSGRNNKDSLINSKLD